MGREIPKFGT
uniref:Uncharacterized protein n=1 Tax=Arundo donax TaxID=35708 RepID=A0A0A9AAC4_ARUDO